MKNIPFHPVMVFIAAPVIQVIHLYRNRSISSRDKVIVTVAGHQRILRQRYIMGSRLIARRKIPVFSVGIGRVIPAIIAVGKRICHRIFPGLAAEPHLAYPVIIIVCYFLGNMLYMCIIHGLPPHNHAQLQLLQCAVCIRMPVPVLPVFFRDISIVSLRVSARSLRGSHHL